MRRMNFLFLFLSIVLFAILFSSCITEGAYHNNHNNIKNNNNNLKNSHHNDHLRLSATNAISSNNRTNILVILADDLGYGDTSVEPFKFWDVKTPELEKMAAKGTVMTNFHTAAATCTPTRASILTGMYPWRVGLKAVYEYGVKYKSNRDDWLPQVPTAAMAFRDNSYFTGHSGKWHVGGMRNDDFDMRNLPEFGDPSKGLTARKCQHPGPNQQGFEEYVSVLDGPGAPRQNRLQVSSTLFSQGCSVLIQNDVPIGRLNGSSNELLSDCEARHAIRMMRESVARNLPFYIHVWFHAPHGPWEYLQEFDHFYRTPRHQQGGRNFQYKTMVSSMDRAIGTLLRSVEELRIEQNTLIVFLSDNGPEDGAGHTAGFRGRKRHVYEGGIRVPCIWQWVGTIPAGRAINTFAVSTDLYPSFLHAANIDAPTTARLDGISLLPDLVPSLRQRKGPTTTKKNKNRVTFWHNDFEGPRRTVAWVNDFKVFLDEFENPKEMYDMRIDQFESNNLLAAQKLWDRQRFVQFESTMSRADYLKLGIAQNSSVLDHELLRNQTIYHLLMVSRVFPYLLQYANHGSDAYKQYLLDNPGRTYPVTPESDQRSVLGNIYQATSREKGAENRRYNMQTPCSTPCACHVPFARDIPTLPFNKTDPLFRHSVFPGEMLKLNALMHLHPHFVGDKV